MPFEVYNLESDESHGTFATVGEARGCVSFDKLGDKHEIQEVNAEGDFIRRVQFCEDYLYKNETDDRVLQGLGLPNWSEARI